MRETNSRRQQRIAHHVLTPLGMYGKMWLMLLFVTTRARSEVCPSKPLPPPTPSHQISLHIIVSTLIDVYSHSGLSASDREKYINMAADDGWC